MTKIRKSAKGENCTLRVPGVCNFDPETTVLCHIRTPGTGIGRKPPDYQAVYGCSACHAFIGDGRGQEEHILPALFETWGALIDKGLVRL